MSPVDPPWEMDTDLCLPCMETDRGTVMVFLGEIEVLEVPAEMVARWRGQQGGLFRALAIPLKKGGEWMQATRLVP